MTAQHSFAASIRWIGAGQRGTASYTAYSRDHEVTVEGKPVLAASSDPIFRGDPGRHSPEDLFVASLAQCHMLWFLHFAATTGLVVREYVDDASGTMRVESRGEGQFTDVTLRPRIVVDPGPVAHDRAVAEIHDRAHDYCYLARSVNFKVFVEPAPLRVRQS